MSVGVHFKMMTALFSESADSHNGQKSTQQATEKIAWL